MVASRQASDRRLLQFLLDEVFDEVNELLKPLVPFECLAACVVILGIARHLVGDGVEGQRARRAQQHQDQVGQAFEAVEARHRLQRRATRAGDGP